MDKVKYRERMYERTISKAYFVVIKVWCKTVGIVFSHLIEIKKVYIDKNKNQVRI